MTCAAIRTSCAGVCTAIGNNYPVIRLLAVLAALWFVLLLATPFLPAPVAATLYVIGSFICHQRPERSFWLADAQLPVCARCIGIYAGVVAGGVMAPLVGPVRRPRLLMILSAVPAVVSLVVEWTGLGRPSNGIRAMTGLVAGSVIAAVALATLHYERCARPRPNAPNPPPTPI
jgi:uncharacterized membrane protein